jgi:hypothetical protein
MKTSFQMVAAMNTAFGNPQGDPKNIDWNRIRSQYKNIFDEYCEGLRALGYAASLVEELKLAHDNYIAPVKYNFEPEQVEDVRDALCDINVFSCGAQHLMGVDGDRDMQSVIDGVMTRFVKDPSDLDATIAIFNAKGVTQTYTEGEFPTMILKSAVDQPDAPKGKFLKSASYQPTKFYELV